MNATVARGCLITIEGGEGAGKTSVLVALGELLTRHGIDHETTREPGGTGLGEAIRALVLDPAHRQTSAESELLLMFAARAQLVRERIAPALDAGRWILSDRYTDASFAYQGGGRGQPAARIADLAAWAAPLRPDLTLLLDLPVAHGQERARARGEADRIEAEPSDFFERVRATYRELAAAAPDRFRIVDAARPLDHVRAAACAELAAFIASRNPPIGGRPS